VQDFVHQQYHLGCIFLADQRCYPVVTMLARHQVAKDKSPDDFLPGGGGEWDKQLLPGALNNNFSMDGNGETTISETISYRKIWIH